MALNGNTMGTQVANAIIALDPGMTQAQKDQLTTSWQSICAAIVTHITGNAQVVVTSVSGVTTGPGVSGPGTGTVT